jgi:O-antigen/teichoic acid export membrane protein
MRNIGKSGFNSNFVWTLIGNVVYAASQWGIISIMAKIGTINMVGIYTLGLAVTAPIFMFTNLQLRAIIATDAKGQNSFGDYLALRLLMTLVALLTVGASSFYIGDSNETIFVVLLLGIAKGVESISDVIYGVFQQKDRMDLIAQSMIFKGILSVVSLMIVLVSTKNIILVTLTIMLSWVFVLLIFDIRTIRNYVTVKPIFNKKVLYSLLKLSIPLGFVMMLISLNDSIPKYFIKEFLGVEMLGFYSSIAYLVIAGNTVVGALGQASVSKLSKYYSSNDMLSFFKTLNRLLLFTFIISLLGILVSLLIGEELLVLLYNESFSSYHLILLLIMLGALFLYLSSILGYGITAARKFKIQPILFIFVIVVNAISCIILIPSNSINGAAYTFIITAFTQFVGSSVVIVKIKNQNNNFIGKR